MSDYEHRRVHAFFHSALAQGLGLGMLTIGGPIAGAYVEQSLPRNWQIHAHLIWPAAIGWALVLAGLILSFTYLVLDVQENRRDNERRQAEMREIAGHTAKLLSATDTLTAHTASLITGTDTLTRHSETLLEGTKELTERSRELERLVTIMPPKNFLLEYGTGITLCSQAYAEAPLLKDGSGTSLPELELSIRLILSAVCRLFFAYEAHQPHTTISANIMLFRSRDTLLQLDEQAQKDVIRQLSFETLTTLHGIHGILSGAPALSTRLGLKSEPDSVVQDPLSFAIPEPHDQTTGNPPRWRVLPGGPYSFVSHNIASFPTLASLYDWCAANCSLAPGVESNMRDYFERRRGRDVGGFMSIALTSDPSHSTDPAGILNVHSNTSGLPRSTETNESLITLLQPIVDMLTDLLTRYNRARTILAAPKTPRSRET